MPRSTYCLGFGRHVLRFVVVVVRMRTQAIPLAVITMRKEIHGFYEYGAPLGGNTRRV